MLTPDDFKLPIDREFTLVKIRQEIDECSDVEALRENLKMLVEQNARFQHMIGFNPFLMHYVQLGDLVAR